MSEHEWCRDTARDEAVRAAEDAAAVPAIQHRDLPDAVAELRERVARLEAVIPKSVSGSGPEARENKAEAVEAVPPPDPAFPGEGMRTERVTLEFHIEGSPPTQWPWSYILRRSDAFRMLPGESVRVVEDATIGSGDVFADVGCGSTDDEVARLAAERDAAQAVRDGLTAERNAARAEAERLRDRVAELEQQIKLDDRWAAAAPAANAGGGAKQEPVAWGCRYVTGDWHPCIYISHELAGRSCPHNGTVVPLYAAPPEPRGWLTAEEREAVDSAADAIGDRVDAYKGQDGDKRRIEVLDALLARESPPRVKVPPAARGETPLVRDLMWGQAIREAGGEVENG